jgi:L-lactate dehydrogenase complex protein LldG
VLVCEGKWGVAENGAIWLPESALGHRAAPFITQHLVVVLDVQQIVWNMHEAYSRVQVDAEGFGVFVAGPSKTADIEQALVIGAHGPRSLTVFLIDRVGA